MRVTGTAAIILWFVYLALLVWFVYLFVKVAQHVGAWPFG